MEIDRIQDLHALENRVYDAVQQCIFAYETIDLKLLVTEPDAGAIDEVTSGYGFVR